MKRFLAEACQDVGWMSWKSFDSPNPFYIGFDIETYSPQGFPEDFEDPIVAATIAISLAHKIGYGLTILYLLISPPYNEMLMLQQLLKILNLCPQSILLTYNGLRFGLTYLAVKAEKYGLDAYKVLDKQEHVYLYRAMKDLRLKLPSYGQKCIERFFGVRREIKGISGAAHHHYYKAFLETGGLRSLFYNIEDSIGCLKILNNLKNGKAFNITKQKSSFGRT